VGDRPLDRQAPLPYWVFVVAASACVLLQALLASRVFLFWDDYYFVGEARQADLNWEYLSSSLFTHFSPVTRLANWLVVGHIASHAWLIAAVQGVLLGVVVCSATCLMVALFGRSGVALLGTIVLGASLTLVPLGSWWTAGVNILPGMAGFMIAFASAVLLVRGRSRWWAVPVLLGTALGVLDYETPILLPGYLVLWVLLFRPRVTERSLVRVLRSTWWVVLGVLVITGAAAINYRLNYYTSQPAPSPEELVKALARSWGTTTVPTALGLHAPGSGWADVLAPVVGWAVTVVGVGWLLMTRRGAWRGLVFAAVGWLFPTLALLLNRLDRYGPGVAEDAIYFYLPTVLTLVGLCEAVLAPRRDPGTRRGAARVGAGRRVGIPTLLVGMLAVYVLSVGPTSRYRIPPGAEKAFVDNARSAAAETQAAVGRFTVIDSLTHSPVMPEGYGIYSRDSNVLGISVPGLSFTDPRPPFYRFDAHGDLRPAGVEVLAQTAVAPVRRVEGLTIAGVTAVTWSRERGNCFTARSDTVVSWRFPQVSGSDLIVRTRLTVDTGSRMVLLVEPADPGVLAYPYPIDTGEATVGPSDHGWLEIIASNTLSGVWLGSFSPGTHVCLQSIDVGQVNSATGP
jgi:hypothetical protein